MQIVYHSFEGRYSDSPRALYESLREREPGHSHLWLTDPDHEHAFPADVEVARYGSTEARAALESADVLIANTHTDVSWTKRPDMLYLQTWHGTPLKRVHRDVLWAPPGRLDRLDRDVARWDVLVSPNRPSTPLLRQAFRYDGPVLQAGYPRNDALVAPGHEQRRADARAAFGIGPGQTAVLYAPTWRDDEVFAEDGEPFRLALDTEAFARELGDDHVLLLRLHPLVRTPSGAAAHPSVRDVTGHPEISDLYLAADVLITDYSSAMFDFALTGRPMLFYVYDLETYQRSLRGFYFDFAPQAPGPLLRSSREVLDALHHLPDVERRHAARAAGFRRRYCHLEDGRATDRVLDLVLHGTPAERQPAGVRPRRREVIRSATSPAITQPMITSTGSAC
jgi:CDP-glycerol glycerophosphotransferase